MVGLFLGSWEHTVRPDCTDVFSCLVLFMCEFRLFSYAVAQYLFIKLVWVGRALEERVSNFQLPLKIYFAVDYEYIYLTFLFLL